MSLTSDFRAAVADLPKLTKAVVGFATAAAASEGTIAAIAQYTHVIPPGWTQAIAGGISVIAAFGAILTEVESSVPVGDKIREVLSEVTNILDVAEKHGVTPVVPVPVPTPVITSIHPDVVTAISNAAAQAAESAVEQVINDFRAKQ